MKWLTNQEDTYSYKRQTRLWTLAVMLNFGVILESMKLFLLLNCNLEMVCAKSVPDGYIFSKIIQSKKKANYISVMKDLPSGAVSRAAIKILALWANSKCPKINRLRISCNSSVSLPYTRGICNYLGARIIPLKARFDPSILSWWTSSYLCSDVCVVIIQVLNLVPQT